MIIAAPRVYPVGNGALSQPSVSAPARLFTAGAAAAESTEREVKREELRQAIAAAIRANKSLRNSLELSLDSQSGEPIVRVVDSETGQLIRQIPSEEILELRRSLDRIAAGQLIHRTA